MEGRDDEGASNGIRDMVALNKVEMLPWDAWGAQPKPNEVLDQDQLAFFGSLVELTREPDAHFDELQRLDASDALERAADGLQFASQPSGEMA